MSFESKEELVMADEVLKMNSRPFVATRGRTVAIESTRASRIRLLAEERGGRQQDRILWQAFFLKWRASEVDGNARNPTSIHQMLTKYQLFGGDDGGNDKRLGQNGARRGEHVCQGVRSMGQSPEKGAASYRFSSWHSFGPYPK